MKKKQKENRQCRGLVLGRWHGYYSRTGIIKEDGKWGGVKLMHLAKRNAGAMKGTPNGTGNVRNKTRDGDFKKIGMI